MTTLIEYPLEGKASMLIEVKDEDKGSGLALISLCYVVGSTLFAIISAERQQFKPVARGTVFKPQKCL